LGERKGNSESEEQLGDHEGSEPADRPGVANAYTPATEYTSKPPRQPALRGLFLFRLARSGWKCNHFHIVRAKTNYCTRLYFG